MTHLKIEQNYDTTSLTSVEVVSSDVITKLYNLALAGLDASSNLAGNLLVANTFRKNKNYLEEHYSNLHINVTGEYYVEFDDPKWNNWLLNNTFWGCNVGDGTGVLQSRINAQNPALWLELKIEGVDILDLRPFENWSNHYGALRGTFQNAYLINTGRWLAFKGTNLSTDRTTVTGKCVVMNAGIMSVGENTNYNILAWAHMGSPYNDDLFIPWAVSINKFYIGNPIPADIQNAKSQGHFMDKPTQIYVPIGSASLYAAAPIWSDRAAGYLEYDFENDPDGIFDEINEKYTWWYDSNGDFHYSAVTS